MAAVAKKLRKLRRIGSKDRPFVIVSDPFTGKFVQFAGSRTDNLLLDVPTEQLMSAEEIARAQALLGDPVTSKVGGSARSFVCFQRDMGEDTDAAAGLAVQVMERVFESAGHALVIEGGMSGPGPS